MNVVAEGSGWPSALGHGSEPPEGFLDWAARRSDPLTAFADCARADWILWALAAGDVDRRALVLCACDCAQAALPRTPDGDGPWLAIKAAETWAKRGTPRKRDRRQDAWLAEAMRRADLASRVGYVGTRREILVARAAAAAAASAAQTVSDPSRAQAAAAQAAEALAEAAPGSAAPTQERAHAELIQRILRRTWPAAERPALAECRPALSVAWDLVSERGGPDVPTVSTPALLSALAVRGELCARLPELGQREAERSALLAVAQRIVGAPDPNALLATVADILAS